MNSTMITGTRLQIGGRIISSFLSPFFAVVLAVLLGFVVLTSAPVQAQGDVPTVPSLVISDITTTTASVTVEATVGCDIEDVVLEYSQDASGPYTTIASGVCSDLAGNEYELAGLTANTEYYVRASATLEDSEISTDVVTPFTTAPIAQLGVTSVTVSGVTPITATVTIAVSPSSQSSYIWYRYRTGTGQWIGSTINAGFGGVSRTIDHQWSS